MLARLKHVLLVCLLIVLVLLFLIYAGLWLISFRQYPADFGVNFSPKYAVSLGLDWKETYRDILTDLKPKYIRLSVPWDEVEAEKGQYNYADIDYLLSEAAKHQVKVTLNIGQKVPRWPECFFPDWSKILSAEERRPLLLSYLEETVKRYRDNPVLEYWQVENEPFIKFAFGHCEEFDLASVEKEIELVRSLDPAHQIVETDSGEMSTWYSAAKSGDILGSTLYRVVYSRYGFIWHYYYLPTGLYLAKARLLGKDYNNFFISELQAEPWFKEGNALSTPLPVQEETMNVSSLKGTIDYAQRVGASRLYFWGAEWWYWMKTTQNDSRYWDIGQEVF